MTRKTRIVIVDDEPDIVEMFSMLLRVDGYEVASASTGEQGLALALEICPEIVLLDVRLPDLSGVEICRHIKAAPRLADSFVVLCSGEFVSADHKVLGLDTGADDYLTKPIDAREFRARIRTIARLQETAAALRASEQHYRRLVEILPDAVSLITPDGSFLQANNQMLTMLGYSSSSELLGKSLFDLVLPEFHASLKANIASAQQAGAAHDARYALLRSSGEPVPVEVNLGILKEGARQAGGLVCVMRDITARRRAEKQTKAFADLGYRLSGAGTIEQAAQIIFDIASELFGWNAGYVDLYSAAEDRIIPVLAVDTVGGARVAIPASSLSLDPSPLMRRVMNEGAQLLEGGGERAGDIELVPFGETNQRSASLMFAPIRSGGATLGVLSIQSYRDHAYSTESLILLQSLADHCGAAMKRIEERKRANDEMRLLPQRIIAAQESERQRVARDLHDGVNQVIAAAKMKLRKAEAQVAGISPAARELIARCEDLLVSALEENRRIAHDLHPSDLDNFGLAEACREFCKRFHLQTSLEVHLDIENDSERLPQRTELNLFRIVQEALTNVEKHANAKEIRLLLRFSPDHVALKIQDDGCGFDPRTRSVSPRKGTGIGLRNMRERTESMGGVFEVESLPGKRTTISVRVPRKPDRKG